MKKLDTPPLANSNEALALHLSEAIRITRERDDLSAGLYNDLAEAVTNFENNLPSSARMQESDRGILLALDFYIAQTKKRKGSK